MATYYVGPGGSDSNNGTSYGLRKLTLNGVEDIPVAAGDTVYVAPGTYAETLTCDVSGSNGSPITYIADWTGENTSGVGGVVRITLSNNNQTNTRSNGIDVSTRDYRTFRGFHADGGNGGSGFRANGGSNVIFEDCVAIHCTSGFRIEGAGQDNTIIRRCIAACNSNNIYFSHSATVNDCAHIVENCMVFGGVYGIRDDRVGGITVRHCTIFGVSNGIRTSISPAAGQTITVNYCTIFSCGGVGMQAATSGDITEDNNNVSGNNTDRTSVTAGGSSVSYMTGLLLPLLISGMRVPQNMFLGELADWSPIARLAGSGSVSDDMFGMVRPATESKNSLGAFQYNEQVRETTTTHAGGVSMRIPDAGRIQKIVPVTAVSTTFSVFVQWEADYAGTKPQLVVRQPGVSETTDTATGSSGAWEELSITLTPSADTNYVIVELVSNNTATSGNYDTFFDTFTVT